MALYAGMPKLYMREFINPVDWLKRQLSKLGVTVKLGTEATVQTVQAAGADAVIVATGATAFKPDIPGVDKPFVSTEDDYLAGKAKLGAKVVVLGGKWGAEAAVSLAREDGVDGVTLVEESDGVASVLDGFRQAVTTGYLADEGVVILTGHKAVEVTDEGVKVMDRNWNVTLIPADTAVISMGRVANDELATALEGKVAELYKIGDCNRPNEWQILFAMEEANFVALRL